jgi:hypothetical protein
MASLADLFNPTFLMFLGILVLVVALLVVYFESKMRDQNHKIASMLSLVSTLAEDMNGVKMGLNHLVIRGGQGFQQPIIPVGENLGNLQKTNLIEVSDDEDEDEDVEEEESDNEESDNEESNNEESNDIDNDDLESVGDESDSDNEDDNNGIKIIKLQVSNEDISETGEKEEINNLDFEHEDLADLEGDFEPEVNNEYVEEVLDLKYDTEVKHLEDNNIPSSSDLKTISINLGEEHQHQEDNIDYKKLQLAKLRSIAVEKGLTSNSEASKLKKPELLKLLGAE